MSCGCGGGTGTIGAQKLIVLHLTHQGAAADPLVQQAQAQAAATEKAAAPVKADAPSAGPSTALLVGGGAAALAAIGGITYLATRKKGRRH